MTTLTADELLALPINEQMQLVAESTGGVDIRVTDEEVNGGRIHVHFVSFTQEHGFSGRTLDHAWHQAFVKWCLIEKDHNGLGEPDEESA